jgi:hypothetical protein
VDSDAVDIMFNIVDFPLNRAEAMAFAKYSNNINCIFQVSEDSESGS